MEFNHEEYLKKFPTLELLIEERNRIHQKYYINTDQPQYKILLGRQKLRYIGSELCKYRQYPEEQESDEWINSWN